MANIPDSELLVHAERCKGKVVLITGAANGIGREAALTFAKYGAKIMIGDVDASGAAKTAKDIIEAGGQATSRQCDVTKWEQQAELFESAYQNYGAIDIVVVNAGVTDSGKFLQPKFENGRLVKPEMMTFEVNLVAAMYTAHLALHYLTKNRTPESLKSLVLMGSMASWQAIPGAPLYSASKAGILGFMRSLHPMYAPQGIRIGTIDPFFAATAIVPDSVRVLLAGVPFVPVERIAGAIVCAATDPDMATSGCAWVLPDDGPVFRVSGGQLNEGAFELVNGRIRSGFKAIGGLRHIVAVLCDLARIRSIRRLVLRAATVGMVALLSASAFYWRRDLSLLISARRWIRPQ